MVPKATPTDKGRSLRSGRTLPDHGREDSPESDSAGGLSSEEEEEMSGLEAWDQESSTASSDISDWTAEARIDFSAPRRKQRKRRRK